VAKKYPENMNPRTIEELSNMDVFYSKEMGVGVGLNGDEIIGLIRTKGGQKGAGKYALVEAIENGGRRLDALDGPLNDYYSDFGFEVVKREKNWTSGEPDVIFMELNPEKYAQYKSSHPDIYADKGSKAVFDRHSGGVGGGSRKIGAEVSEESRAIIPDDLSTRPRPAGKLIRKESEIEKDAYQIISVKKDILSSKYDGPIAKNQKVVFTAGGTGAGKTTGLKKAGVSREFIEIGADNIKFELAEQMGAKHGMTVKEFLSNHAKSIHEPSSDFAKELFSKRVSEGKNVVFDSNLTSKTADKRIQSAIDAGAEVEIVYVHRGPIESWFQGVLPRKARTGRDLPVEEHAMRHAEAPKKLLKLHGKFGDKVKITVIDNSRGRGNEAIVPIDFLNRLIYTPNNVRQAIKRYGKA
jgi:hypothetical protein